MADDLGLEITGRKRLKAKITDPALPKDGVALMLRESGQLARRTAVEGVTGGRGLAVNSITLKTDQRGMQVRSVMPTARVRSIDKGRRSGASLGTILAQLIRWKDAVGFPEPAIVLAKEIRRRGVKGRFFVKAAQDAVSNLLPTLLPRAAQRIQERWDRP